MKWIPFEVQSLGAEERPSSFISCSQTIWGQVFYYHISQNIKNNINIKCDNKRPDPGLRCLQAGYILTLGGDAALNIVAVGGGAKSIRCFANVDCNSNW